MTVLYQKEKDLDSDSSKRANNHEDIDGKGLLCMYTSAYSSLLVFLPASSSTIVRILCIYKSTFSTILVCLPVCY